MKTLPIALLLMASLAFVLFGCSDNSDSLVTPGEQTIVASGTHSSLGKVVPIPHSVVGGGWWDDFGNGKHVQNTIAAHEYADGSYGGQYLINADNALGHKSGSKWNAKVVFVKVYTNVPGYERFAVIGGIETTGAYAGTYDVWFVIDNGPGSSDLTAAGFSFLEDIESASEEWNKSPAELIAQLGLSPTLDGGNFTVK